MAVQRWMGHHSAAFTLDNNRHLFDDSLGPHLSVGANEPRARRIPARLSGRRASVPRLASTRLSCPGWIA